MLRNRKGVTLFELMTVVVLGGIVLAMTLPRMSEARRSASIASARAQVESYFAFARTVAIRNGGKTQLVKHDNTLMIQADTGTGWITAVQPIKFDDGGISVKPTVNTIVFDSRGLAVGLNPAGEKFYIKVETGYGVGKQDSVCITRLGGLLDRNCGAAAP